MSEHAVNVIEITEVLPHDNADKLEIVPIDGWQAIIRKGQFKPGDKAVYIQPDYVVPLDRPEFAFLAKAGKQKHRLKAIRLRGALSYGLLIDVPAGYASADVGDNLMEALGIERYEPIVHSSTTATPLDKSFWPKTYTPTFDLENLQNLPEMLRPGEMVVVSEKVDGANARYLFLDGEFHVGSRNRWLKDEVALRSDGTEYPRSIWHLIADRYPQIRVWCEGHPGTTLFGEIFGKVQSLKYGIPDELDFRAFAALHKEKWIDLPILARSMKMYDIPVVPRVYSGPFDLAHVKALAEEDSTVSTTPGHMREGVVVTPLRERVDSLGRRVSLKLVSNRFWESEA